MLAAVLDTALPKTTSSAPMPLSSYCNYRIDPDAGIAYIQLEGNLEGAEIARCAEQLSNDADWHNDYHAIWDDRLIDELVVTTEGLDEMVAVQAKNSSGLDLIVTQRPNHFMLMKLYAWRVRKQGRPARVCMTLQEALEMLGLSELPEALQIEQT